MHTENQNDDSITRVGTAQSEKNADAFDGFDDENIDTWEHDRKKKQVFHGTMLLWVAYQATGVIYGDIGTSPLYVYSSTFSSQPSYDDLLGALSLIIWSLTIIVTIKYVFIVLCADDEGEGGTFALFSLLSRYVNIVKRDPGDVTTVQISRYSTNELKDSHHALRTTVERSTFIKLCMSGLSIFGVTLVMADGVLTPAQSILGGVQGLKVVDPDLKTGHIVGITCAILIVLFLVQPIGVGKLANGFAPIVILWLLFNLVFGIYNLVKFDHTVLKAFSPYFAGQFFVRNGTDGWKSLGGILLAFTGVEALYADLGAFSKRAIQLSWLFLAYPCLLFAYIGQAAYISKNEGAYSNPFFNSVPNGMFWPSFVLGLLAAIVASQATITAVFQLLTQVISLNYFPKLQVIHTSTRVHGQIYVPVANWLMMIGCVIVTAVYNNTTSLGNAYGVCVILVTFITTIMVAFAAVIVWRINIVLVATVFFIFACFDGMFLSAALTKVPHGAWFTLVLAAILAITIFLWRYGKHRQWIAERKIQIRDKAFHDGIVVRGGKLWLEEGRKQVSKIKGIGIFLDKTGFLLPTNYTNFLRAFEAEHAITVFLNIRYIVLPKLSDDERYSISKLETSPNTYRIIARYGYNEVVPHNLSEIIKQVLGDYLTKIEARHQSQNPDIIVEDAETQTEEVTPVETTPARRTNLVFSNDTNGKVPTSTPRQRSQVTAVKNAKEVLINAFEEQVVFLLGKQSLMERKDRNIFSKFFLACYTWLREQTTNKVNFLGLPVDQVVEIGCITEI